MQRVRGNFMSTVAELFDLSIRGDFFVTSPVALLITATNFEMMTFKAIDK